MPPLTTSFRYPGGLGFLPLPLARHQVSSLESHGPGRRYTLGLSVYGVLGVPLAAAYVNGPSAEFDDYADEWI